MSDVENVVEIWWKRLWVFCGFFSTGFWLFVFFFAFLCETNVFHGFVQKFCSGFTLLKSNQISDIRRWFYTVST